MTVPLLLLPSTTFVLGTQGDNTITWFATDNAGRSEPAHTTHVKLDNQAPSLNVTSRTGDMTHAQWRATCAAPGLTGGVCGATADGTGSGLASVSYVLSRSNGTQCFDGTTWTSAACTRPTSAAVTGGSWLAAVPDSVLAVSRTSYTITITATDVAGNATNTTRTFSVG